MTNQEIIEKFESDKAKSSLDIAGGVFVETDLVYEIVKALQQQSCEDAISRAQAQTELEMNACRYTLAKERDGMGQVEWSDQLIKVSDAVDIIRHLPSVTPQPKTGHWIYEKRKRLINETDEGAEYITDYWCKCSKCGGDFGYRKMEDAFCKYCGARMIESQAESEET